MTLKIAKEIKLKGVTGRLTVLCCATFLVCWVMTCCWSDFPNILSLSRIIWSVTHPLQFWAKLSKPHRRESGGNWIPPPPKDRPPKSHQQELREPAVHQVSSASVVRPIRFLLLHTSLWHTCKHVEMHANKNAARTCSHMHKQINTHNQTNASIHTHTQSYPHSQCPS